MATTNYSITCGCCKEVFTSMHDARAHLDGLWNHAKSFENQLLDQVAYSEPISAPASKKRRRAYLTPKQCDECKQTLLGKDSLKRHAWIHDSWNRPCDECNATHEFASAYISHKCADGKKPDKGTKETREQFVKDQLHQQHQDETAIEDNFTRATVTTKSIEATEAAGAIEIYNGSVEGVPYQEALDANNSRQSLWQNDWDVIEDILFDLDN
ncbi:hypothetical protein Forpi1262_v016300 [Fusarium oxysporum f. sp. raphani]|uniref:C2H2-type domain-containing protein n=1 Tax=Fusarium oxysporum f. sp. raphani TaxID=96318 RepID=A0A8J5UG06_FUSOX|nr:hypothetical protein Forpi1262_v016300 [Fusarium oxysporum f. sp. raphani]KAH7187865.1 hypothetical protein BKA60DRAFT_236986 [Fusarium oxysporum]